MTEQQVRDSGRSALIGKMPMTRVGRARERSETQGFMKVLIDAETKKFLGATIAYLAGRQHDAVGLIVFDEAVREHRRPSSRAGQMQAVLHAMDRAEPGTGTDLASPFARFQEFQKGRGLVAVARFSRCCAAGRLDFLLRLSDRRERLRATETLVRGRCVRRARGPARDLCPRVFRGAL